MHLVHLALGPDAVISALLDWSDCESHFQGASRDKRLESMWNHYRDYCEEQRIPDRAARRLFTVATLKPESIQYVEISQKILSATACRYLLFWFAALAKLFAVNPGSDADMYLPNT